jgi:hypothetical protein
MNVISLRNGTARPEEMLRNARMTGVVKLQRCIKLLSQVQLWVRNDSHHEGRISDIRCGCIQGLSSKESYLSNFAVSHSRGT